MAVEDQEVMWLYFRYCLDSQSLPSQWPVITNMCAVIPYIPNETYYLSDPGLFSSSSYLRMPYSSELTNQTIYK